MEAYITLIIVAVCLFAGLVGVVLGYFLARLDSIYTRLMKEDGTGPVDFFRKENCHCFTQSRCATSAICRHPSQVRYASKARL